MLEIAVVFGVNLRFNHRKMKLENARELIENSIKQTNSLYGGILFDEWAVVVFHNKKGVLLSYWGPRKSDFQKNFAEDISALSTALKLNAYGCGDFEFARHAEGSKVDAFVMAGQDTYLFCNNLSKSMADIVKDPKWLAAQSAFAELCERFRSDPLQS